MKNKMSFGHDYLAAVRLVVFSVLVPLSVGACANNDRKDFEAFSKSFSFTFSGIDGAACEPNPGDLDESVIQITFRNIAAAAEDPYWCAIAVNKECAAAKSDKWVKWISLKEDGSSWAAAEDKPRYKIYFHPFVGGNPIQSNGLGIARERLQDSLPPEAVYKYTIWDWPTSGDNRCKPLDPNVRVY